MMEWVIVGYDACGLLNGAHLEAYKDEGG